MQVEEFLETKCIKNRYALQPVTVRLDLLERFNIVNLYTFLNECISTFVFPNSIHSSTRFPNVRLIHHYTADRTYTNILVQYHPFLC